MPPTRPRTLATARAVSQLWENRDYHNRRLRAHCGENRIRLADICARLHDQHLGDALHPNGAGATIIAEEVFGVLRGLVPSPTDSGGSTRP